MIFRTKKRDYYGADALEIVRAMESDAKDYPHPGQSIRQFLRWSLRRNANRLPPRDTDLSDRMKDEELALSYLYLRDEYGEGKLLMDSEVHA
ncbi:MAG: hypothetical protein KIS76_15675 [Pyrinomonadaceae bacterium]|nr:hypothetical protein [Pyrinomonadaceae bacterium]